MLSNPLISVITPAYNSARYIEDAISSVQEQTFKNWEMVIVDDASTDSTVDRVHFLRKQDPRIKLLCNTRNKGPGPTRNLSIRSSKGRYIAFLDSDDKWLPDKLTHQLDFMQSKNSIFSFTSYEIIDESGQPLDRIVAAPDSLSYSELLKNTAIGCLTVMIDRTRVTNLRMPDIPSRQPLVLWLRILKQHGPAYGINEVLAQYRVRPDSVSSNKINVARQVWRVYRDYEKLDIVTSMKFFVSYAFRATFRNLGVLSHRRGPKVLK